MTDWRAVQRRLRDLGFNPGPIDGVRGPKTDAAIVRFKQSIGLRARPYLGPLTKQALFDVQPERNLDTGLPWLDAARSVMGLHEARNTSQLRSWFDKSVSWIDPRDVPWCGAFVATAYRLWDVTIGLPSNPLGARNWMSFGYAVDPQLGACLVFWRGSKSGWKGHVGFYWGEDDTHYHVLGGNQKNRVSVTRVSKSRRLGARWPVNHAVSGKRIRLSPDGTAITTNEA
ncbi:MAG: peptidoglycan-binding protein [Roseovarius sp.]|uniref:NlpC/P60 family protein n=1 Tax=Roseovarius sp. TaxID=1486281 RepID=UPI0032EFC96D